MRRSSGCGFAPVYYLLEDLPDVEVMLVNVRHVTTVPGRKTDVADATWLAQLGTHGLVKASFVPPEPIRQLRDPTRARTADTREAPGWSSCWRTQGSNCPRWPLTS